ncbi:hypothetical protein BJY04DRAFT_185406 [Aspergillus karnatakaensis]|uniref:uncharacterized protein n=1 Tax=Aspergillus karnatakaensis TaxID=1810916 RepID=UPI003CCE2EF9
MPYPELGLFSFLSAAIVSPSCSLSVRNALLSAFNLCLENDITFVSCLSPAQRHRRPHKIATVAINSAYPFYAH